MFYCGYQCDKCGKAQEYTVRIWGISNLRKFARWDGWSVGNQVLCPNCRRGKKKEDLHDEHK